MQRRDALKLGVGTMTALAFGPHFWERALAGPTTVGDGPYGLLGDPDENGVRLPAGFTATVLATTAAVVAGTDYTWHGEPDGAATFVHPAGGWLYVCNSELNGGNGGAGVLRFDENGQIIDAYRILAGTKWNCSGGATPWGTWLSCEEFRNGFVWECNPFAPGQGVARPALGKFIHEAAVVDPRTGFVYLTEDENDSRFYRFRPEAPGDLSSGVLEALVLDGSDVTWVETSSTRPNRDRRTASFNRGEGAWFSGGSVYFTTTGDHKVWRHDTVARTLEVIYDAGVIGPAAPLRDPDNITVHERTGDIYVCEDDDDLQIILLSEGRGGVVASPFLQLVGHSGSEIAGPAFSPDGRRFYFSSQRGTDGQRGMTFEVTGPFRAR